jgi:hypothetical protein
MSVKAQMMYKSEDGKLHESRGEAQQYDAMWNAMSGVKDMLQKLSPGQNFGTLHIDIVNKPNLAIQLRDKINKAIDAQRRYGKLKKPATNA